MEIKETIEMENEIKENKMEGFGMRWGALLIDINILLIIMVFSFQTVIPILRDSDFDTENISSVEILSGLLLYIFGLPLFWILYNAIFESSKLQGSPGKIAVKIKVTNKHGNSLSSIILITHSSLYFRVLIFIALLFNV